MGVHSLVYPYALIYICLCVYMNVQNALERIWQLHVHVHTHHMYMYMLPLAHYLCLHAVEPSRLGNTSLPILLCTYTPIVLVIDKV